MNNSINHKFLVLIANFINRQVTLLWLIYFITYLKNCLRLILKLERKQNVKQCLEYSLEMYMGGLL